MKIGVQKITKDLFYGMGGLSNPALYRKATANGVWAYYWDRRN